MLELHEIQQVQYSAIGIALSSIIFCIIYIIMAHNDKFTRLKSANIAPMYLIVLATMIKQVGIIINHLTIISLADPTFSYIAMFLELFSERFIVMYLILLMTHIKQNYLIRGGQYGIIILIAFLSVIIEDIILWSGFVGLINMSETFSLVLGMYSYHLFFMACGLIALILFTIICYQKYQSPFIIEMSTIKLFINGMIPLFIGLVAESLLLTDTLSNVGLIAPVPKECLLTGLLLQPISGLLQPILIGFTAASKKVSKARKPKYLRENHNYSMLSED